jgi:hypothetical protein
MGKLTFDFGINETEATQDTEAFTGYNFDLELAAKRLFPRLPIDLKGTLPNVGSVNGLMQLVTREDDETTLVFSGEATTPAIYSWTGINTSTAFTSERTTNCFTGSMLRDNYWSLDDYLLITDLRKLTPLLNWDGTSCTRHKTDLGSGTTTAITDITESPAGTYTVLSVAHGLLLGDTAIIADSGDDDLDGEHEVTNVPSVDSWQYEDAINLGSSATGTTEKTIDLYAKYSIVHNNRMWLFNITTINGAVTSENPHMILASTFEDAELFDTVNRNGVATGNAAFFTLTPDLKEINGVTLFNRQLIISTHDGALHRLSGLDASDYQFTTYYSGSAAVSEESMVNIGNDVQYMLKGGGIDLLGATDTSGDVRADDVSRWIPTTTKDLTSSKAVYDQQNQKVMFFLSDKILVMFKDILSTGGGSPWTVYETALTSVQPDSTVASIFTTNAIKYMRRPGQTTQTVYFGDANGNIWDLNGSGTGDNGTDIAIQRKTPLIQTDRLNIMRGNVQYRRFGAMDLSLIFDWANEYNTTKSDIPLKGAPAGGSTPAYYNLDSYYQGTGTREEDYYNEGFSFADQVSHQNFSPAGRADAFFMTLETSTTVQFQIDEIEFE